MGSKAKLGIKEKALEKKNTKREAMARATELAEELGGAWEPLVVEGAREWSQRARCGNIVVDDSPYARGSYYADYTTDGSFCYLAGGKTPRAAVKRLLTRRKETREHLQMRLKACQDQIDELEPAVAALYRRKR
jgi:hypothetical protein